MRYLLAAQFQLVQYPCNLYKYITSNVEFFYRIIVDHILTRLFIRKIVYFERDKSLPVLDTGIFTARLHIVYPMLFKLTNSRLGRNTHCGVLEFVADEGKIYLPYWVSWCVNIVSPTFFVVNNVFYRNFVFAQANINAPYLCSA